MRESSKRRRHSRNQPTCLARAKLKTTLRALHMSWSMLELAKLEFHAGSGVNQHFKLLKRNLSRLKAQSAIRIDPHIVTKNFYPALDSLLNRFYRFYLWTVSIYHTERDAFFVAFKCSSRYFIQQNRIFSCFNADVFHVFQLQELVILPIRRYMRMKFHRNLNIINRCVDISEHVLHAHVKQSWFIDLQSISPCTTKLVSFNAERFCKVTKQTWVKTRPVRRTAAYRR